MRSPEAPIRNHYKLFLKPSQIINAVYAFNSTRVTEPRQLILIILVSFSNWVPEYTKVFLRRIIIVLKRTKIKLKYGLCIDEQLRYGLQHPMLTLGHREFIPKKESYKSD